MESPIIPTVETAPIDVDTVNLKKLISQIDKELSVKPASTHLAIVRALNELAEARQATERNFHQQQIERVWLENHLLL